MEEQVIKLYSMAFKQQVVREYETGKTVYELKKKYGITGNGTIQKWVERYGWKGLRHKVMRIQHIDEQNRVTGVAEADEMNERMMKAVRNGGLGLSEKEADELCRYFEKVVAQGVDVNYKN